MIVFGMKHPYDIQVYFDIQKTQSIWGPMIDTDSN